MCGRWDPVRVPRLFVHAARRSHTLLTKSQEGRNDKEAQKTSSEARDSQNMLRIRYSLSAESPTRKFTEVKLLTAFAQIGISAQPLKVWGWKDFVSNFRRSGELWAKSQDLYHKRFNVSLGFGYNDIYVSFESLGLCWECHHPLSDPGPAVQADNKGPYRS